MMMMMMVNGSQHDPMSMVLQNIHHTNTHAMLMAIFAVNLGVPVSLRTNHLHASVHFPVLQFGRSLSKSCILSRPLQLQSPGFSFQAIGIRDRRAETQAPLKFGKKYFLGQLLCKIRAFFWQKSCKIREFC